MGALMLVVLCFALLLMAGAVQADWSVSCTGFKAGVADPNLKESSPSVAEMGGTVLVQLENAGPEPLVITDVLIGETRTLDALKSRQLWWWRQRPNPILPGQFGVVELNGTSALFPPGGGRLSLTLISADGSQQEAHLRLWDRGPVPSYAFREGEKLTLFVRNDDPWARYELGLLKVNGQPVEGRFNPGEIGPGETALLTVEPFHLVEVRQPLSFELASRELGARSVRTLRACTLADPRFPIGIWQSGDHFRESAEYRTELRKGYIDAPFVGFGEVNNNPEWFFTTIVGEEGFRPMWNPRPWSGEDDALELTAEMEAFLETSSGRPDFIAFNSAEEPDWHLDEGTYSNTYRVMKITELLQSKTVRHPIAGTLARDRLFYAFAPIFDTPIFDAYRVTAPAPDDWPFLWGTYLETLASYTSDLRRNAQPAPCWVWAQGAHVWTERALVDDKLGRPVPSPEEAQAQLYMQLGSGAKGVLWFRWFPKERMEREFRDDIAGLEEEYGIKHNLTPEQIDAAITQYGIWWDELWEAQKTCNCEMARLRPILSRADVWQQARVVEANAPNKLFLGAVASEQALVLYLVNLDYDFNPRGYVFHPQQDVEVEVILPAWAPHLSRAWLIQGEKNQTLNPRLTKGKLRFTLPELACGAIILVGKEGLAESLKPDTQSLLP